MFEVKIMNTGLVVALLGSLYVLWIQHRERENLIVKAKLVREEILKSRLKKSVIAVSMLIWLIMMGMLSYAVVEEFHGTKPFRDEYSISFLEAINDSEMEMLVEGLEGDEKEWGEWVLKKIRGVKVIFFYLACMFSCVAIFIKIAPARIEKSGIRRLGSLTMWNEYSGYYWKGNQINLISCKGAVTAKCSVDFTDRAAVDKYLIENTNLDAK